MDPGTPINHPMLIFQKQKGVQKQPRWPQNGWLLRLACLLLALAISSFKAPALAMAATHATITVNIASDNWLESEGDPANCVTGNPNTCQMQDAIAAAASRDTINFAMHIPLPVSTFSRLLRKPCRQAEKPSQSLTKWSICDDTIRPLPKTV